MALKVHSSGSKGGGITGFGLIWRALLHIATNSAQPLLMDLMKYHGAASPSTFAYVIPTYLGMILVGLRRKDKSIWEENWKKAMILTLTDMVHQLLEKAGLVYAGSSVYMVVSSSSIVWTAIISWILLRKRIDAAQWISIITIGVGLSLKAFQVTYSSGENEIIGAWLTLSAAILFDIFAVSWELLVVFSLFSGVFGVIYCVLLYSEHALTYVLNEMFLTGDAPIQGPNLTCMNGLISTGLLATWTVVWTVPRADTLILKNIEKSQGNIWVIFSVYTAILLVKIAVLCFVLLLVCSFLKSSVLYELLKECGATSTAVLKGARTPTVFMLSHIFYCHIQSSQCLTPLKFAAAVLVTIGIISYSLFEKKSTEPAAIHDTSNAKKPLLRPEIGYAAA